MELLAEIELPRRSFTLRVALSAGAERLALIGPSGAGKTSLLRALAGLEPGARGRIELGGEVWLDSAQGVFVAPERRRIGYLPQDYGLFPHMTVAGNVRFAAGRARPELLERLGIGALGGARPGELSGGERQRAALARALAREPKLLLLDEPFAALDVLTRRRVRTELATLLAEIALPAIVVSHSFADAVALAGLVAVLDRGEVVQSGTPAALLASPASDLVAELTAPDEPASTGAATRAGAGRPPPTRPPASPSSPSGPPAT